MSDVYSSVGDATPSYSAFKFHPTSTFDFDIGQVIPILRMDCIPGDRIRFENGINIQFMPLVSPLKHNITAYVNYFFVPYRIIWDDWITFITGGEDGTEADNLELPNWGQVKLEVPLGPESSLRTDQGWLFTPYTYWDYVGNPMTTLENFIEDGVPDDFPYPHCLDLMAYNMIYNEWYRDQNVMDKRDLKDCTIFNQCWNKDYFTSALPWQQRGLPARIPVVGPEGTYIPLHVLSYGFNDDSDDLYSLNKLAPFYITKPGNNYFSSDEVNGFLQYNISGTYSNMITEPYSSANAKTVLSQTFEDSYQNRIPYLASQQLVFSTSELQENGFSISVTDLRLASSLQRWMERNARTGVRYVEFLKGHYNVDLPDSTAQRPILLGSTAQDIVVSDVYQTSETSESSALGSLAGNASSAAFGSGPEFHCLEYGCVLALLTVVPAPSYMSQGFDKSWMRRTRFDFAFPEFMHISEVPIKNYELYYDFSNSGVDSNSDIFGYQSAWDEYRQMHSYVSGAIRDSMDSWTLSRKFASPPHLNKDFLEINGKSEDMKRIFAVTDPNEPGMVCYAYHNIDALRPIPYISEPMLIA